MKLWASVGNNEEGREATGQEGTLRTEAGRTLGRNNSMTVHIN